MVFVLSKKSSVWEAWKKLEENQRKKNKQEVEIEIDEKQVAKEIDEKLLKTFEKIFK